MTKPDAGASIADEDNCDPMNYRSLLNYRLNRWAKGEAIMEMDMRPALRNNAGVLHGGAIASLIDAACGHAATWSDDPERPRFAITLSLTVSFTGQVVDGKVFAQARIRGGGRKIVFCVADVLDDTGKLVAFGEGTFRYRSGSER